MITGRPYFSICMPSYNSQQVINATLASVVNASFEFDNFEVIVVDDGSTDETVETCVSFLENAGLVFKVQSEPHRGRSYARNKAVELSQGKYVVFLDSDDFISPGYFENLVKLINENGVKLIVSEVNFVDEHANSINYQSVINNGYSVAQNIFYGNLPYTSALCVEKQIFEFVGGFDISLEEREDWDLSARLVAHLIKSENKFLCLPERFVNVRKHNANSSKNDKRYLANTERVIKKLSSILDRDVKLFDIDDNIFLKSDIYKENIKHFSSRKVNAKLKLRGLILLFDYMKISSTECVFNFRFFIINFIKLLLSNHGK